MHLSHSEFDRLVERALNRIPERFRAAMENLVLVVEPRPDRALLNEMGVPPGETLFGVFQGVPLTRRSFFDPPLEPDRIVIFQEPLESCCRSLKEMEREVEITVVHELAHYLGMDEDELAALGYA